MVETKSMYFAWECIHQEDDIHTTCMHQKIFLFHLSQIKKEKKKKKKWRREKFLSPIPFCLGRNKTRESEWDRSTCPKGLSQWFFCVRSQVQETGELGGVHQAGELGPTTLQQTRHFGVPFPLLLRPLGRRRRRRRGFCFLGTVLRRLSFGWGPRLAQ